MQKVGLVTYFRNNYGSALQCYALKTTLERLNYQCDLIERKNIGRRAAYKSKARRILKLALKSLIHPKFALDYHKRKNVDTISETARKKIDEFVEITLKPRYINEKYLKALGEDNSYNAFISGSDQIWNANTYFDSFYFLTFTNIRKLSYATSFGSSRISSYNLKAVKNALSKYENITVRENAGRSLLKKLNLKANTISDPITLLTPLEWRAFSEKGYLPLKNYVLLHFLNEPNEIAIKRLQKLDREGKYDFIVLSYNYDSLRFLNNTIYIDASPEDYISLIDNASMVTTDSFHTTYFSLLLDTPFSVFKRNYPNEPQEERIMNLLNLYNCNNRLIEKDKQLNFHPVQNAYQKATKEREKGIIHLIRTLDCPLINLKELKDEFECTGCGLCIAQCKNKAITFRANNKGYEMPFIDKSLCTNCNVCSNACHNTIPISTDKKTAYIAYYKNRAKRRASASGGIFNALAREIIKSKGIVYGAAYNFGYGHLPIAEHKRATNYNELRPLLNSKYVQSDASKCYELVKNDLKEGKTVLFSGTSCQIEALLKYLNKKYDTLYTIDLICHGVPGRQALVDYMKKIKAKTISFRRKDFSGKPIYELSIEKCNGEFKEIPLKKSSYYKNFIQQNNYRDACYYCKFASINKPSDITLGDYLEVKQDYPDIYKGVQDVSSVIVHTKQGRKLLEVFGNTIEKTPVDIRKVQLSHEQLYKPSFKTKL